MSWECVSGTCLLQNGHSLIEMMMLHRRCAVDGGQW